MIIFLTYWWVRLTGRNYRVFYDFDYCNAVQITRTELKPEDTASYSQVKRYVHI